MLLSVQEHPYVQCIYSILQIPEHTDYINQENSLGTSLVVQWLRLQASTIGSMGLIPGQGTKIPHAARRGQKAKTKTNGQKTILCPLNGLGSLVKNQLTIDEWVYYWTVNSIPFSICLSLC